MKPTRLAPALALALSTFAFGCSSAGNEPQLETEKDLLANKPFVAVSRAAPFSEAQRDGAFDSIGVSKADILEEDLPSDFYLAIHRDQLNSRWFLSAYVRQFFPGAVFGGAARTLGTAVVSWEVQNNKLFMVSADARHATGDVFAPTVILDAFPVITDFAQFEDLPNAENYVLFDPAAGINDFAVAGDMFSATAESRFAIDLSFLQAFRSVEDGVTYEQVFTGHSEAADFEGDLGDSPFRAAGTLGVSLRAYGEGEGYQPTQLPDQEHYFRGEPSLVANEGSLAEVAAKWNIQKGGKPIEWVISREVLKLQADPLFAKYDLLGALEDGIESWNQAFGFPAITARLAEEGESFSQDDKNVFIVDPDPTAGFAFANWRLNPNTGEIRGASIYFSSTFLRGAAETFDPQEEDPDVESLVATKHPKIAALSWMPLHNNPACSLHAGDVFAEAAGAAADEMTPAEKVEAILHYVAAHEVGHTLGLRHNFLGSALPPSSSVMDYLPMDLQLEMKDGPGAYDTAAIQYLYGLSQELPAEPFCTDPETRVNPACAVFDAGADPLADTWQPRYEFALSFLAEGSLGEEFDNIVAEFGLDPLLGFVRAASTPAERLRAWNMILDGLAGPASTEAGEFVADFFLRYALEKLFLTPPEELAASIKSPVPAADVALMTALRTQVGAILRNDDQFRSFPARRAMVDVLKAMQATPALSELIDSRDSITDASEDMTGEELLLTQDLLARITAALSPYFE